MVVVLTPGLGMVIHWSCISWAAGIWGRYFSSLLERFVTQPAQFSSWRPVTRLNSLVLFVTKVALRASAWQAIQRSLAPMDVPAARNWVNCLA